MHGTKLCHSIYCGTLVVVNPMGSDSLWISHVFALRPLSRGEKRSPILFLFPAVAVGTLPRPSSFPCKQLSLCRYVSHSLSVLCVDLLLLGALKKEKKGEPLCHDLNLFHFYSPIAAVYRVSILRPWQRTKNASKNKRKLRRRNAISPNNFDWSSN